MLTYIGGVLSDAKEKKKDNFIKCYNSVILIPCPLVLERLWMSSDLNLLCQTNPAPYMGMRG